MFLLQDAGRETGGKVLTALNIKRRHAFDRGEALVGTGLIDRVHCGEVDLLLNLVPVFVLLAVDKVVDKVVLKVLLLNKLCISGMRLSMIFTGCSLLMIFTRSIL